MVDLKFKEEVNQVNNNINKVLVKGFFFPLNATGRFKMLALHIFLLFFYFDYFLMFSVHSGGT